MEENVTMHRTPRIYAYVRRSPNGEAKVREYIEETWGKATLDEFDSYGGMYTAPKSENLDSTCEGTVYKHLVEEVMEPLDTLIVPNILSLEGKDESIGHRLWELRYDDKSFVCISAPQYNFTPDEDVDFIVPLILAHEVRQLVLGKVENVAFLPIPKSLQHKVKHESTPAGEYVADTLPIPLTPEGEVIAEKPESLGDWSVSKLSEHTQRQATDLADNIISANRKQLSMLPAGQFEDFTGINPVQALLTPGFDVQSQLFAARDAVAKKTFSSLSKTLNVPVDKLVSQALGLS